MLARVAESQPARCIVAYREPNGGGEARMDAWISAQCSLPIVGGPQICSEVITVAAPDSAAGDLPNTVLSLLVPDLQVYLYWRSFQGIGLGLGRADYALFEPSDRGLASVEGRSRAIGSVSSRALIDSPGAFPVRDLNWSRLTAWRDLVTQFFDNAAFRDDVHRISEVEYLRSLGAPATYRPAPCYSPGGSPRG